MTKRYWAATLQLGCTLITEGHEKAVWFCWIMTSTLLPILKHQYLLHQGGRALLFYGKRPSEHLSPWLFAKAKVTFQLKSSWCSTYLTRRSCWLNSVCMHYFSNPKLHTSTAPGNHTHHLKGGCKPPATLTEEGTRVRTSSGNCTAKISS